MSVDQTDVVDGIGVDSVSGKVVLTISDHLEWSEDDHLLQLQEKVNTYLSFVETGELLNSYPDAKGRDVLINVVCKYPPDDRAVGFLRRVANIVDGAGIKFGYHLFDAN